MKLGFGEGTPNIESFPPRNSHTEMMGRTRLDCGISSGAARFSPFCHDLIAYSLGESTRILDNVVDKQPGIMAGGSGLAAGRQWADNADLGRRYGEVCGGYRRSKNSGPIECTVGFFSGEW